MPIESIAGFRAAKQEAINSSNTSTYRDNYVHIEWIEDNYYQLNIHDTYLGDGNSDIIGCYRNGEYVKSHQEMSDDIGHDDSDDITEAQMQEQEQPDEPDFNDGPMWSDDMYY